MSKTFDIPNYLSGLPIKTSLANDYGAPSGLPNRLIVIHSMEAPENSNIAENIANWFSTSHPNASADFCIDNDSIVYQVPYPYSSWAAPGVNGQAYNLEHAGYAAQTREQWLDDYSLSMLKLSAQLVARLCKYSPDGPIPVRKVTANQILNGEAGICGHLDVTNAYPSMGNGHTDPGYNFPWDYYLSLIQSYYDGADVVPTPPPTNNSQKSPDINELAEAVIRGEYGNGETRKEALGSLYDAVQARVNEIVG